MWKLILADGTELTGFTLSGNNFIREEKVDESVFADNLSTLTMTDGEETMTMTDAELIQQVLFRGKYYLCFREPSEQEKQFAAMQAQCAALEEQLAAAKILLGVE